MSSSSQASGPFNHRDQSRYPISPKQQLAAMASDLLPGEVEPAPAFEEDAGVEVDLPLQQHRELSRQRRSVV